LRFTRSIERHTRRSDARCHTIYVKIRFSYEFETSGCSKLRFNRKYVFICLPISPGFSSCIIIIRFSPISDERILYVKFCGLPSSDSNMAHNTLEVSFFLYRCCTRLISLSAASTSITHDFYLIPFSCTLSVLSYYAREADLRLLTSGCSQTWFSARTSIAHRSVASSRFPPECIDLYPLYIGISVRINVMNVRIKAIIIIYNYDRSSTSNKTRLNFVTITAYVYYSDYYRRTRVS